MGQAAKKAHFTFCGTKVGWDIEIAKEQFLSYSSYSFK